MRLPALFAVLAGLVAIPFDAEAQCPPEGYTVEMLLELKASGFEVETAGARDNLAVGLLACTGHPDPDIRDGVTYSGISYWLRRNQLSDATVKTLMTQLLERLNADPDDEGLTQPFSALVLSEVARTDRISPAFSEGQRQQLVDTAAAYLESISDYRGFSDKEGWRHGVAHGADLALQLVLNPASTVTQLERLLTAVARQVSPDGEVFYVYGESARLARPVFYAHQREILVRDWWASWLQRLTDPAPMESWNQSWSSNAGLARRHNTMAFLLALHFNAVNSGTETGTEFVAMILDAMKGL